MWESLWKVSLEGKDKELIRKTLIACFSKYEKPFTPAGFERLYKDLKPIRMHKRNMDALALPKNTYHERKEIANRYLEELKQQLSGE